MPKATLGWYRAQQFALDLARRKRVVRARDLTRSHVPNSWLLHLDDTFDHIGPGLYVVRGDRVDPLIVTARKYPRLTLSLTSALWLHGLHWQRPDHDWWSLGKRDRIPTFAPEHARFLRSSWPADDRTLVQLDGASVAAHTPERALLECVRFRRLIGEDAAASALRFAVMTEAVTEERLASRAEELRVRTPLLSLLKS